MSIFDILAAMHNLISFIAQYVIIVFPVAWLVVLATLPKQQRWRFTLVTIVAVIFTAVLVKIGTSLHQDPRPFMRDHVTPYFKSSTDNGFPSDHTAFGTVLGLTVLYWRRKTGICLTLLALLIGTARVISGVHHAQDIVGGALFATVAVSLALGGYVALSRKTQLTNRSH